MGRRKKPKAKLPESEAELKMIMIYGLEMQQEEKQGIRPAYHRPLTNKLELLTAIMFERSADFRNAIKTTHSKLSLLNDNKNRKTGNRKTNKKACLMMQHPEMHGKIEIYPWTINYDNEERRVYGRESTRLRSFETWPIDTVSTWELSINGFYFTLLKDIVRCFACGIEISGWGEKGKTNPLAEHHRWSPMCTFIAGFPSGNIKIKNEDRRADEDLTRQLKSGIHDGPRHSMREYFPGVDFDFPYYLEQGYTLIENIELEMGGKGFSDLTAFGECSICKNDIDVLRDCPFCNLTPYELYCNQKYIISIACPFEEHKLALQLETLCYRCKHLDQLIQNGIPYIPNGWD